MRPIKFVRMRIFPGSFLLAALALSDPSTFPRVAGRETPNPGTEFGNRCNISENLWPDVEIEFWGIFFLT